MFVREIFVFVAFLLCFRVLWQQRRRLYLLSKIPKVSPFEMTLKNMYAFYRSDTKALFKVLQDLADKTQSIAIFKFSPVLIINVVQPEDVKIFFNSKDCVDKPYFIKEFPKMSQGTLFGHVEPWRSHKRILNPFFSAQALRTAVIPIFNRKVRILMESIGKEEGKGEFNIFHYMTALTLETILSVMEFDVDIQRQERKKRDAFIKNLENYGKAVTIRSFKFWLHIDFIYNRSMIYKIERKAAKNCAMIFSPEVSKNARDKQQQKIDDSKPKTLIRALVDPKNGLTPAEIEDEISTLLVAAQDTSAVASSSVLLLLAMHKEVQAKVVAELHEELGISQGFVALDVEQLSRLNYLDMVINEAMRLMPVVPLVCRTNRSEITSSEGYVIPANSNLIFPIFKIHKNKKFWGEDAEKFKPERFAKESFEKIHPYAFIPFSKGPRMCIGWRYAMFLMKIQLANFLLRYEVDTTLKLSELEYEMNVTLNVCQGHMISIKRQSN